MTRRTRAPKNPMIFFIYDLLFCCFALAYLPFFFLKGKHRGGFGSRFGAVPQSVTASLKGRSVVWIHAVSVGEIGLAVRLASVLKERCSPSLRVVFTTTTLAGREVAEKIKSPEDTVLYFPIDLTFCIRRFIRGISPKAVILLETEIWPNLIRELHRRRVPAFIVNGRISDKAIAKYRLVRFFMRHVFENLSGIGAQNEAMRARFLSVGAAADRVQVTGNMKFDWQPVQAQLSAAVLARKRLKTNGAFLLVAGSTHEGEEELFFNLSRSVEKTAGLVCLVAPRHLERLSSVVSRAAKAGVSASLFSQGNGAAGPGSVFILDQMGILPSFYEIADVVFVGGSLVPVGGHNPVEPAYFGCPILFGPHMNNFADIKEEFKREQAAFEVQDAKALEEQVLRLMKEPALRKSAGEAAYRLVQKNQGAARRNIETFIQPLGAQLQ